MSGAVQSEAIRCVARLSASTAQVAQHGQGFEMISRSAATRTASGNGHAFRTRRSKCTVVKSHVEAI